MNFDLEFFITSVFMGVGLAMDAFSVSVANGLNEPFMKTRKVLTVSTVFAFFQFAMPLIGWFCVSTLLSYFKVFQPLIPYIALGLLSFIGGKMIIDGIKGDGQAECCAVGVIGLILQGIATSIDALSVGFTTSDYNFAGALASSLIIGAVTFVICFTGIIIGKKVGNTLSNKATIVGGIILILIGLEIFVTGVF